jgi:hypothetical protein
MRVSAESGGAKPWDNGKCQGEPIMNKLAIFLIVAIVFLAAAAQTGSGTKLNRSDAGATAAALLKAYAAKDLPAMAELSTADNRDIIRELIAQGENHPRWRSIFSGGRWDAVSNWKGELGEVRYLERTPPGRKEYDARVQFGKTTPDKVVVVSLSWEGGKWCFEDVNFPSRESFENWSKTRPAMP